MKKIFSDYCEDFISRCKFKLTERELEVPMSWEIEEDDASSRKNEFRAFLRVAQVQSLKGVLDVEKLAMVSIILQLLFASGLNGVIYAWDRRLSHYAYVLLTSNSHSSLNSIQLNMENCGSSWRKNIRWLPMSQRGSCIGDWMLTSMLLMRMKLLTVVACLLLVPFRGLIEAPFVHGRAFAAVAKLSPVLSQRLVDQFLHAAIGSIALDVCGALNEVYMPHT
ncbi:hypothetical protein H6P81_007097 [Aristolochia fimbriata]|uniref:Uncharacterized protein n=1 Tax=Aristolochia fimbriata TaxID=158543 RepID=A0AAV7EZF5_ARIFI|nr:hypothetical protein H6P81_007097 [Aristolochia fimbriata]